MLTSTVSNLCLHHLPMSHKKDARLVCIKVFIHVGYTNRIRTQDKSETNPTLMINIPVAFYMS